MFLLMSFCQVQMDFFSNESGKSGEEDVCIYSEDISTHKSDDLKRKVVSWYNPNHACLMYCSLDGQIWFGFCWLHKIQPVYFRVWQWWVIVWETKQSFSMIRICQKPPNHLTFYNWISMNWFQSLEYVVKTYLEIGCTHQDWICTNCFKAWTVCNGCVLTKTCEKMVPLLSFIVDNIIYYF